MSTKRKRNILAIALSTALLLAAVITLCGFAFAAETEEIPANGAVESAPAPARDYPYLKGTRYKNLYAAGYSNLFKATIEEPVPEEAVEAVEAEDVGETGTTEAEEEVAGETEENAETAPEEEAVQTETAEEPSAPVETEEAAPETPAPAEASNKKKKKD